MNGNRKKGCRTEMAMNALLKDAEAGSGGFKSKNVKDVGGVAEISKRKESVEDRKKIERAEKLVQWIFWGPNWWS